MQIGFCSSLITSAPMQRKSICPMNKQWDRETFQRRLLLLEEISSVRFGILWFPLENFICFIPNCLGDERCLILGFHFSLQSLSLSPTPFYCLYCNSLQCRKVENEIRDFFFHIHCYSHTEKQSYQPVMRHDKPLTIICFPFPPIMLCSIGHPY